MTLIPPVQMRLLPPERRGLPTTYAPLATKVTPSINPQPKTRVPTDSLIPLVISVAPAAATFAIATTRDHPRPPPPLQPGEPPLPADPLPDLPAAGMEDPVPPEDRVKAKPQDNATRPQPQSHNTLLSHNT